MQEARQNATDEKRAKQICYQSVVKEKFSDVSEKHTASIFRIEVMRKDEKLITY
jgi:hypothetical protein